MYQYTATDQQQVDQRVIEFQDQTNRYLAGKLSEEQFRPLRLMNGLYIQRHAPMLRVAIPYGELSSGQLRKLAQVARKYDRGYGHITTRQNIQFNWLKLEQVPELLGELATVQMHAIQTSGNCIRNITCDHLAGIDAKEVEDPRPWCERIRQWASLHPEFLYLPRKFKIAVTGSASDRAAILAHDIGLRLVKNESGEIGFCVSVGGGLGRTPMVGKVIAGFLPKQHLLSFLESILRVYNLNGRRDNKYKSRIKILLNSMGLDSFKAAVNRVYEDLKGGALTLTSQDMEIMKSRFAALPGRIKLKTETNVGFRGQHLGNKYGNRFENKKEQDVFNLWKTQNTLESKFAGFSTVFVSLKKQGVAPGDLTALEMDQLAALSDQYSGGVLRTTHRQNLLFPLVDDNHLYDLWRELGALNNADPSINTLQDIICCPGLAFCGLANTTSIPVAMEIQARFADPVEFCSLGDIQIKISGCMNACGHHHIGHIGILGVDKKGEEWFQITLGGRSDENLRMGDRLGPAVSRDRIVDAVETIIRQYITHRKSDEERFLDTYDRIGVTPFKEAVYG